MKNDKTYSNLLNLNDFNIDNNKIIKNELTSLVKLITS